MINGATITCPAGCEGVTLPALDVEQNCSPLPMESQICGLFLTKGELPTDWTDETEWETLVLNDVVATDAEKYLVGVGGISEPEETVIEGPKLQDIVVKRIYTLTLEVFNLSDAQYEFLRTMQCGDTEFVFWYESISGQLYGGPNGIVPKSVKATLPKENSRDAYDKGFVTIVYEALVDPDRTAFSGIDTSAPVVATVEAYGPTFNGTEYYTSDVSGSEFYAPIQSN